MMTYNTTNGPRTASFRSFANGFFSGLTPVRCEACRFFTLTEVVVTVALSVLIIAAALSGLLSAQRAGAMSAQHTCAVALCQDALEEMRAAEFDDITTQNFPESEEMTLTHTTAPQEVLIPCTRLIEITDESEEDLFAKRVRITVEWDWGGQVRDQHIESIVYDFE